MYTIPFCGHSSFFTDVHTLVSGLRQVSWNAKSLLLGKVLKSIIWNNYLSLYIHSMKHHELYKIRTINQHVHKCILKEVWKSKCKYESYWNSIMNLRAFPKLYIISELLLYRDINCDDRDINKYDRIIIHSLSKL